MPVGLCDELKRTFRAFWWGTKEQQRMIHWLGWDCMSRPKKLGGLSFTDLGCFNQVMLAKQMWQLLLYDDSLVTCVSKDHYFRNFSFFKWIWGVIHCIFGMILYGVENC